MKKTLVIALVVLLSICMLAGCSGGSATPTGKYALTAYEINGEDFLEWMKAMGGDEFDASAMCIEFQRDGTFTMEIDDSESGTFTVEGKTITLTVDGDTMTGTVDGNKVILEEEEDDNTMRMVFEKK